MSFLFNTGDAEKIAEEQAGQARRQRQTATEDELRARQLAERGGGAGQRGRNLLTGSLSSALRRSGGRARA